MADQPQPQQEDTAADFTILGQLSDDAWQKIADTVNKAQTDKR